MTEEAALGHGRAAPRAGGAAGLVVVGLSVTYATRSGDVRAVRSVDLTVRPGEVVGLVGESGCGKSSLGRAVGGMLPTSTRVGGRLQVGGKDLSAAGRRAWDAVRGRDVVWVPQGGMGALDQVRTVGAQLREQLVVVGGLAPGTARGRAEELLEQVGLPTRVMGCYPHELSGGMRQRVALSLAVALHPRVVVADEPTTGLDTDAGARVLDLLVRRCREEGWALLLVSHDLPLLATRVDRLAVMYAGRVVEDAPTGTAWRHPYARALVRAVPDRDPAVAWAGIPGRPPDPAHLPSGCAYVPRCAAAADVCRTTDPPLLGVEHRVACHRPDEDVVDVPVERPARSRTPGAHVLDVRGVSVRFASRRGEVTACDRVDVTVRAGEVVALLGPSGSGKSTLARVALGLLTPETGRVVLGGADLTDLRGRRLRHARRRASLVHQDVYGALHPAMTVRQLLAEPLRLAGTPRSRWAALTAAALRRAGLGVDLLDALPHRLSGGQRQRVAVARALVGDPVLVVADEPTSMLDAALRADAALLLRSVADEARGVLLITHDRGEATRVADRVVLLRAGRVESAGPTAEVLTT